MAGIDSLISNRVDAFANNPQALMQRYSMSQDLLDLLALQKLKQEKEAAQRSLQMQMQAPQGTVKDQLEGQVMDMTRREVAQAAAPGLQQQGQRMVANQMQEAMGAGLPTQPAPALQGMAQGGIVGYAPGGRVSSGLGRVGEAEMDRTEAEIRAAEMIKEDPEILALMAIGAVSPELAPLLSRVGTRRNPLIRDAAKYGDDMPGMASLRPRVFDPRQGAAGTAAGLGALLATREQSPSMGDIGRGENALAGALNRLNTAPEGGATAVGTSGTPDQNIQISKDALRRFDERRGAEAEAETPMAPAIRPRTSSPGTPDRGRRVEETPETGDESSWLDSIIRNYQNAMRLQGEGNTALYNPKKFSADRGAADYVRMMENPELAIEGMTDFERAKAMGLIPEERPAAPAAPAAPTTTAAPAATQDPEEVAYLRSLYRQYGLPAVAPQQEQTKERPQFRSRYEDRLAEIEAEKQDKLGALIEFLQAAGASGGTNLGATLTGGGSGLRARDERLRQQETEALKSAVEEENAYLQRMFNEEQLRQQADIARQNREMQERLGMAQVEAEAKRYGEQARLTQAQIDAEVERYRQERQFDLTKSRAETAADLEATVDQSMYMQNVAEDLKREYEGFFGGISEENQRKIDQRYEQKRQEYIKAMLDNLYGGMTGGGNYAGFSATKLSD